MKKVMDDPSQVVSDTLQAFAEVHAAMVMADLANKLCLSTVRPERGQVAIISGGGSGHEPLHAGFVGEGMLTGAVLGDIFASPTADQILEAARACDVGGGVLFIVKNYTGDVLNFRLAAELAQDDGIDVATVVVDDDISLPKGSGTPGRRGTAATVFVEKIAGAAAAAGATLIETVKIADRVVANARSLGFALTSCSTPMAGRPTFQLGEDEIEFGVGIHGEQGVRRERLTSASKLAADIVQALLEDLAPPIRSRVLVLTNGLGSTPLSELYPFHGAVVKALREHDLDPMRQLVGNYVTSLDMAGCSVSILRLDNDLTNLWDARVRTPALAWG